MIRSKSRASGRRRAALLGVAVSPLLSAAVGGGLSDGPAPRVIASWLQSPLEVRFALDAPADESLPKSVTGAIPSEGPDPNEEAGRGSIRIASARLLDGGRTLALATDPHPFRATYRPSLPGVRGDATYTLAGAEVEFAPEEGDPVGPLWWPEVDPTAARERTKGSAPHDAFFAAAERPGKLTVRALLGLPAGHGALALRASSGTLVDPTIGGEPMSVKEGDAPLAGRDLDASGQPIELAFDLEKGAGPIRLELTWAVPGSGARPVPPSWQAVPWAPSPPPSPPVPPDLPAHLAGGDAKRGEAVFRGEAGKCSTCHAVNGQGGAVGPTLDGVGRQGAARVYREVLDPSAFIRPEYVSYTVSANDGRVLAGVVRSEGADSLKVVGADAKEALVARSDIQEIRPSATSIMPVGLPGAIGEAGMRDLIAYLMNLTNP